MSHGRNQPQESQDDGTAYLIPNSPAKPGGQTAEETPITLDGSSNPEASSIKETTASGGLFESGPASGTPWDSAASIPSEILPGQVLFDLYLVEKLLGQGGMGSVWLVRNRELNVLRALKLIVSGIAADPQIRARFRREAQIMASFNHQNAVTVHTARFTRDIAFIEMEYVRGKSINTLLKPGQSMPLGWVTRILYQLCDALEAAHDHGIIHRDLKPTNLMLLDNKAEGKEHLKVLDFGIAKFRGDDANLEEGLTKTGQFIGTPQYASPEQITGSSPDKRSDLYSVGVMLYEFLTGYRPFSGGGVLRDHILTAPPPFSVKNPHNEVPEAVERVVMRCLAKEPEQRPSSAMELYEEFARALPGTLSGRSTDAMTPFDSAGTDRATDQNSFAPTPAGAPASAERSTQKSASTEPIPGAAVGFNREATQSQTTVAPSSLKRAALILGGLAPIAFLALLIPYLFPGGGRVPATPTPRFPDKSKYPGYVELTGTRAFDGFPFEAFREADLKQKDPLRFVAIRRVAGPESPMIYLPEGFEPENDAVGVGYPSAIVRGKSPWSQSKYVLIEGGTFEMGDFTQPGYDAERPDVNRPSHPVRVSSFYIQDTEVTNGQFREYLKARGLSDDKAPQHWFDAWNELIKQTTEDVALQHPAVGIPYVRAMDYARWIGGRLPTEAEWEFTARSRGRDLVFVSDHRPVKGEALIDRNGNEIPPTLRVRSFKEFDQTAQKVFDLLGSVREMCADTWAEYESRKLPEPWKAPAQRDPIVTDESPSATVVVRGGSWKTTIDEGRTFFRMKTLQKNRDADDVGFRVVIELLPTPYEGKSPAQRLEPESGGPAL